MVKRRVKRPLNKQAVQQANNAIYRKVTPHGRALNPTSAADASLRKEWMDVYLNSGGEKQLLSPSSLIPITQIITPCSSNNNQTPSNTHKFETHLGVDIDTSIMKCPAFQQSIQTLQDQGWHFEYGTSGKGTSTDKENKKIVIDSNEKGNTILIVGSLAHEIGHAQYQADPYVAHNNLTEEEYVNANLLNDLKDEGEATLTNIEIKNCLKKNKGVTITVAGAHSAKYEKIANNYPEAKDRDQARVEIGQYYADHEKPTGEPSGTTYRDYYEKTYRDFYKKIHKK
jgi:hypothetical protein